MPRGYALWLWAALLAIALGVQCQNTVFVKHIILSQDGKEVALDLGRDAFNDAFRTCPVVRYVRNGKPYAFYRRLTTVPATFDAYGMFALRWADGDNKLNKDFELFSEMWMATYASNSSNKWQFCNYNDDVGFPRDCGPTKKQGGNWFGLPPTRSTPGITSNASLSIAVERDCAAYPDAARYSFEGAQWEANTERPGTNDLRRSGTQVGDSVCGSSALRLDDGTITKVPDLSLAHVPVAAAWTLGLWVRFAGSGSTNNGRVFFHMGTDRTGVRGSRFSVGVKPYGSDGRAMLAVWDGVDMYDTGYHVPTVVGAPWVHIAAKYIRTRRAIAVYVNEVQVYRWKNVTCDFDWDAQFGGMIIGSSHTGNGTGMHSNDWLFDEAVLKKGLLSTASLRCPGQRPPPRVRLQAPRKRCDTSEAGGGTTLSLRLTQTPDLPVTVSFTVRLLDGLNGSNASSEVTIQPAVVELINTLSMTIRIEGVDDDVFDGDIEFVVEVAVETDDPTYRHLEAPVVPSGEVCRGANEDDDPRPTPVPPTPVPPTPVPPTPVPPTPVPPTPVPPTPGPPTPVPPTPVPPTPVPPTPVPPTPVPPTPVPPTPVPPTPVPPTPVPPTPVPPTPVPPTPVPPTPVPPTPVPPTPVPPTPVPPFPVPPTPVPPTPVPPTPVPPTPVPPTPVPPTPVPPTPVPPTPAPTSTPSPRTPTPPTPAQPSLSPPPSPSPLTPTPTTPSPPTASSMPPSTPVPTPPPTYSPLSQVPSTPLPPTSSPLVPPSLTPLAPLPTAEPRTQTQIPPTDGPPGIAVPPSPPLPQGNSSEEAPTAVPTGAVVGSGNSEVAVLRTQLAKQESVGRAAANAATVGALVGGSVAAGVGLRMLTSAAICGVGYDDEARYYLAISPLDLSIAGSRAAGVVVGNTALCGGLLLVACAVAAALGAVLRRFPSTRHVDAFGLLRVPAVPLAAVVVLYHGAVLAAGDMVFNSPDVWLIAGGIAALLVTGALPFVLRRILNRAVPHLAFVHPIVTPQFRLWSLLFGKNVWVSHKQNPHYASRWAVLLYPLKVDGLWFVTADLSASFLTALVNAYPATTYFACGNQKLTTGMIFVAMLVAIGLGSPHLAPHSHCCDTCATGLQAAAMFATAAAYYSEEAAHVGYNVGSVLLSVATGVLYVRIALTILGFVLTFVTKRRQQAQAMVWAQFGVTQEEGSDCEMLGTIRKRAFTTFERNKGVDALGTPSFHDEDAEGLTTMRVLRKGPTHLFSTSSAHLTRAGDPSLTRGDSENSMLWTAVLNTSPANSFSSPPESASRPSLPRSLSEHSALSMQASQRSLPARDLDVQQMASGELKQKRRRSRVKTLKRFDSLDGDMRLQQSSSRGKLSPETSLVLPRLRRGLSQGSASPPHAELTAVLSDDGARRSPTDPRRRALTVRRVNSPEARSPEGQDNIVFANPIGATRSAWRRRAPLNAEAAGRGRVTSRHGSPIIRTASVPTGSADRAASESPMPLPLHYV